MLSICIPVYNRDVGKLVTGLAAFRSSTTCIYEIILIDDGSEIEFLEKNKILHEIANQYILLEKNIGRAAIRNEFLKYAKFDYLLFLDCDSTIFILDFVENYFSQIADNQHLVICGGNDYPTAEPSKDFLLRWNYSHKKESRVARSQNNKQSFMSNNFVVKKSLFKEIKFDDSLTKYGHEDTLFGYELKKRNIEILHINNPVMNDVLDSNEDFLKKTELGIENLVYLCNKLGFQKDFIDEVFLLKFYFSIKNTFVTSLLSMFYTFFSKIIRKNLANGNTNLKLFDFYKLIYLNRSFQKK